MLAETAIRVSGDRYAAPTIIAGNDQRFLVADDLRSAGIRPRSVILEPISRNTAASVAVGAISLERIAPEAIALVLPSDHLIRDAAAFHEAVEKGLQAAARGDLVTFGVIPNKPEPGFGYIHCDVSADLAGIRRITSFEEKPRKERAAEMIAAGNCLWNSGILLFRVSTLLDEMAALAPEILAAARSSFSNAVEDLDFFRLHQAELAEAPAISIDCAVMERTRKGAVVPVEMGWSDLGSFEGVWGASTKDALGNASTGETLLVNSSGCLVQSENGMLTAVAGMRDAAVIVTGDAVLVMNRHDHGAPREIVEILERTNRRQYLDSPTVFRPWGSYRVLDQGAGYLTKRVTVKPGAALSLQYHNHRAEHWVIIAGVARVTRENETFLLHPGESALIKTGDVHRLENPGPEPLLLIEVQTGSIVSEDDIVRLDDRYGREQGMLDEADTVKARR